MLFGCVCDDAIKAKADSVVPRLPDVDVDCSACLSCGIGVLLVMTGCMVFHILMVLGKKDALSTCGWCGVGGGWNAG